MKHTGVAVMLMVAGWTGAAAAEDRKPPPQQPAPPVPAKQPTPTPVPAKRPPPVRTTVESKRALAVTTLTADALVAKIEAAYAAQIRRCYGELIARTPGARGKVVIELEVTPRGETSAVRVRGLESSLETCIAGQVAAWRFPVPRSAEGGPIAARFEVGYRLQPEPDVAMAEEDARRFADMLTSGPDPGPKADMSSRRPTASLDSQIAEIRDGGKTVAIGGGGGRGARGSGDVRTGKDPDVGPGSDGGTKVPAGPAGRVSVSSKQAVDATSLEPDAVLAKVMAAYMAGIKRCYKQRLIQDPTARGTVTLAFEVTETGRTRAGKVTSFEASVGTCIEGLLASWRFPVPKDGDGEPTTATFRIGLTLVPD